MKEATCYELSGLNSYGQLSEVVNVIGKDGSLKQMLVVNPLSYIHAAFHQGDSYTELMMDTF